MENLTNVLQFALTSAITLFVIKELREKWWENKRSNASKELLRKYAEKAIEHIDESVQGANDGDIREKIKQGNPHGEKEKNYTPYILFSEEDKLSFAQVREIFQNIKKEKEQKFLLEYFIAQAKLDSITRAINSDFVQSLPQQRKVGFWNLYVKYRTELREKAKQFVGKR